jgi:fatty-acyl-CoA synthase
MTNFTSSHALFKVFSDYGMDRLFLVPGESYLGLLDALVDFPGLAECAVVGLPDERWGEVPVLVLTREASIEGQNLRSEAILMHLQKQIARFKLPRRTLFLEHLPKSALGKVQKSLLQQQLMASNS